jgi:hypothetical protein
VAQVKNYGLSGVHRTLQLGKQGPVLVGNADTDSFTVTLQDAATLTTMGGANASSPEHFITKAQLDVVYTEAQFLANVNYNSSSPILLGNISAGTKTIITTFEVDTAFDGNAVITVGTGDDNSLLMSDSYAEIEVTGSYQTTGLFEFASDTSLNIYVTQGGATTGTGKIIVSVVDGPVVDGGTINYGGAGGGIALADLSVTTASPSGNGSLTYNDTTGVFTFTPANVGSGAGGGAGGDPAYKGFKAHYGSMYNNNDDPNGPINKIVIYKDTVTPSSTIDTATNDDTFTVTGLSGSDVVAMLVVVGENVNQTPTTELKTFAESIIDNVILDGGVEGSVNTIGDMKQAFYDNFATFSATITDRKANLEFFSVNNQFSINPQYSTGDGATFTGISYNMDNDTLDLGSWGQGAPNTHEVNDVHVIPGNTIQDANGNFLQTPANDVTVTITGVSQGAILSYTVTGSLPRPSVIWPSNYINDGGSDEYDTGNYINTDLDTNISYNDGNVVTSSSAFGGGDYVVTYQDSIFGVFATGADINTLGTDGGSGFDGNGVGETGSLYGATESGVDIGNFVFNGDTLELSGTGGNDMYIKSPDDLFLDALGDDVIIRSDDDTRIRVGYNFTSDSYSHEYRFNDSGELVFYNSTQGNDYGFLRMFDNNDSRRTLSLDGSQDIFIRSGGQTYTWKFDNSGITTLPGSVTASGNVDTTSGSFNASGEVVAIGNITGSTLISTNSTGNEGGEIQLAKSANATITGGAVIDSYNDRIRIFEGGGNARGVYVDLAKAPNGVAGELLWKASGVVDAGTFVTLDNLKVTVPTSGNRGLSVAAVSGSFSANIGAWFGGAGVGYAGSSVNNLSVTTTPSVSLFDWNFTAEGNTAQYTIYDKTNSRMYRVTMMIGPAYLSNFISIERLY